MRAPGDQERDGKADRDGGETQAEDTPSRRREVANATEGQAPGSSCPYLVDPLWMSQRTPLISPDAPPACLA